jgi:hypothetical protein
MTPPLLTGNILASGFLTIKQFREEEDGLAAALPRAL